jgi:hypothetical protein
MGRCFRRTTYYCYPDTLNPRSEHLTSRRTTRMSEPMRRAVASVVVTQDSPAGSGRSRTAFGQPVVTFMRAGVAVRVTASIGSPYKCAAAGNPARWAEHVDRLGCDEIRQYHNHPVHNGDTRPSSTDFRTSASLRRQLGSHGPKLKSLIICWNQLREWKVFEHDDDKRHWLCCEFDAAV